MLDIHDGELLPTLENRRTITRLIREWKADVVISHRPNDYHPDHRYTGVLVQDAAFMVTVPFFCPDVPLLKNNPVFLYYPDALPEAQPVRSRTSSSRSTPVIDKKLDALDALESQFYEGGANGTRGRPRDPQARRRLRQVRADVHAGRNLGVADSFRASLEQWYGRRRGEGAGAEAFEICEYGRRPTRPS